MSFPGMLMELLILVHASCFSTGLMDYFRKGKYSFSVNLNCNCVSLKDNSLKVVLAIVGNVTSVCV